MVKTNKRAAIELSLSTLVVIVLSVALLILGIVFIRNLMCSGIQMTENVDKSVTNQLNKLFGADNYGIVCVGEGVNEYSVATGGRRMISCVIKTETQSQYDIKVTSVESLSGANTQTVQKWIIDKDYINGQASPGGDGTTAGVLLLDIPRDAPTSTLKVISESKNLQTDTTQTHTSYIDVVSAGFLRTTMC